MGTSRNPVLFGVQAVNSNLAHHQVQKVALVVEREVGHAPFKGQQGVGNDLLVGHDTLAVCDGVLVSKLCVAETKLTLCCSSTFQNS